MRMMARDVRFCDKWGIPLERSHEWGRISIPKSMQIPLTSERVPLTRSPGNAN